MNATGPRKRRPRTSIQQLAILQETFILEPMPSTFYRELLSQMVGLSSRSIQIWFQNRRQKLKLEENKDTLQSINDKKQEILVVLNQAFANNNKPNDLEIDRISSEIGISQKTIYCWFENRLINSRIEPQLMKSNPIKPQFESRYPIQTNTSAPVMMMYPSPTKTIPEFSPMISGFPLVYQEPRMHGLQDFSRPMVRVSFDMFQYGNTADNMVLQQPLPITFNPIEKSADELWNEFIL